MIIAKHVMPTFRMPLRTWRSAGILRGERSDTTLRTVERTGRGALLARYRQYTAAIRKVFLRTMGRIERKKRKWEMHPLDRCSLI